MSKTHNHVNESTSIPVLLACDGGYAAQLATCLRSMVESNSSGWPMEIHVLVADFPAHARQKVLSSLPPGSASVRWIDADINRFAGLTTMDHVSRMTFARLLIPDVMPAETSRLLYLDADILVLKDLTALFAIDLEGSPLGAVADPLDAQVKTNPAAFAGVPRVKSYFNAGVLLIDLQRWRDERISEKALAYLQIFPSTPYSDQDALNVVCDGGWKELEMRWIYQGHLETRVADLSELRQPAIVHFVTSMKPWIPSSFSLNASLYDSFRRRTLFARSRVQIAWDSALTFWCRAQRFWRHFASNLSTRLL
jgi:lipopolysaccharide biosynthesis glycosyltransferase